MKRLFIDTNIVIDLLSKREPFYRDAAQLFCMAHERKVQLYCSPITFSTASFLLRKHGRAGVYALLSDLHSLVKVSIADQRTVDDALLSRFADFEDAMQYFSAIRAKAEVIITRNAKDFSTSTLPVMSAAEYIATI